MLPWSSPLLPQKHIYRGGREKMMVVVAAAAAGCGREGYDILFCTIDSCLVTFEEWPTLPPKPESPRAWLQELVAQYGLNRVT